MNKVNVSGTQKLKSTQPRLASGIWRLASGVWRLASGKKKAHRSDQATTICFFQVRGQTLRV
jgi:hypothetical protein